MIRFLVLTMLALVLIAGCACTRTRLGCRAVPCSPLDRHGCTVCPSWCYSTTHRCSRRSLQALEQRLKIPAAPANRAARRRGHTRHDPTAHGSPRNQTVEHGVTAQAARPGRRSPTARHRCDGLSAAAIAPVPQTPMYTSYQIYYNDCPPTYLPMPSMSTQPPPLAVAPSPATTSSYPVRQTRIY